MFILQHKFQRIFFVLILVYTFSAGQLLFIHDQAFFFCWWCFGALLWSLQDAHNFSTNFFIFVLIFIVYRGTFGAWCNFTWFSRQFWCFLEQNSQYSLLMIVIFVRSRFLTSVFESCFQHHTNIIHRFCSIFVISHFQCLLHGLHKHQQHNKQETNVAKNTKRTNMQTHNKGVMIHTRMPKKTITISTINSHMLQKKKIIQTEIHKRNSNFRNSKSDKKHEQ